MKFVRRSGILIPRKYEQELWYQKIKDDLTRRAQDYQTSTFIIQKFYLESDKYLLIPRFYPVENVNKWIEIEDVSHEGRDISISHNITPRNALQSRAVNHMLTHNEALMELQPGVGKTVISIMVIATRKKKALILVHRESLSTQWKNRILEFTNLQDPEISILTSANYQNYLASSIIIATCQTFLSLLKRNRINFLTELDRANIGILIGDEVHTTVGAPTFSECSIHMPCKYVYGLSATPYRWDGNTDIITYHLGPTFADEDTEGTMVPNVTILALDFAVDQPKRFKYLYWAGKFQRSRYLNIIKNSEIFMKTIKSLIQRFEKLGRQQIVMSERIKLIDKIIDSKEFKDSDINKFIAGSKLEVLQGEISLSTPGKIRDGVDVPHKDTLIMTSPISNIAQVSGRVTRTHPNKQVPIIVDMVDISCGPIRNTIWTRIRYYEEKCWNVQYVHIDNDYKTNIIDKEIFKTLLTD